MKLGSIFLFSVILPLGFTAQAQASAYRDCMSSEMNRSLVEMNCDFSRLNSIRSSVRSSCGPLVLTEDLQDPSVQFGSEEFTSRLEILMMAANGDVDELMSQKAASCNVDLSIQDSTVTVRRIVR